MINTEFIEKARPDWLGLFLLAWVVIKIFPARIGLMELARIKDEVGFYKAAFTLEEAAALLDRAMEAGIEEEVSAVRMAVRRALLKLEGEMDAAEYAGLLRLVFSGANTVAYLLRTKRMMADEAADSIAGSLAQNLAEFHDERGWEV